MEPHRLEYHAAVEYVHRNNGSFSWHHIAFQRLPVLAFHAAGPNSTWPLSEKEHVSTRRALVIFSDSGR